MSRPEIVAPLSLSQLLQRHTLLAVMVLCFGATAFALSTHFGATMHEEKAGGLFKSFVVNIPIMVFFVLFWRLLQLTYVERDPNRIETLKAEVRGFLFDRQRMVGGLIGVLLMSCVLISFAQLKNLIPIIHPYSWDEYFLHLDRMLHFGHDPYRLAHAVFGWHYIVSLFTGLYNFWLFLMYFVLFGACFMRPESLLRMQFLVAFLLTWAIGGNLFAMIFSSAGPVYYANLGLGDAYSGLMGILHSHASTGALSVTNTQNILWAMHTSDRPLNAISAFPSMHVASSVLMAVFLAKVSRLLGIFGATFAVLIMIGSVLLAWHYAVDGYAGGLIAVASWYAAGWLVRLAHREPADQFVESKA
jgi:membrane-associated phospholipid phosphatase